MHPTLVIILLLATGIFCDNSPVLARDRQKSTTKAQTLWVMDSIFNVCC